MPIVRILLALACLLALPVRAETPGSALNPFASRLLATHNAERARLGIAPLRWSPTLAQQASEWANSLAARGAGSRLRTGAWRR